MFRLGQGHKLVMLDDLPSHQLAKQHHASRAHYGHNGVYSVLSTVCRFHPHSVIHSHKF
jgi:hypothetical protein